MSKPPKKRKKIIMPEEDVTVVRHNQRKLRYLKARRTLRRAEIIMARFRAIMKLVSIVLLFVGLYKLANLPQWYLNPGIFANYPNEYIEIEGNDIVPAEKILKKLENIRLPQKPIYLLNTKPLEKAILEMTPIKKVSIRRFWLPARLKVIIDEKRPLLAISPSPKVAPIAVFTEDTGIINQEFLPLPKSKRVYKILTYDDYTAWSGKQVKHLVYLSELIEGVTGKELKYLDIRNPSDVYAQLDEIRLRLGEIDRNIFARTQRVSPILPETLKIKNDIEYIDLRWSKSIAIKLKGKNKPKNPLEDEVDKMTKPEKSQVKKKDNKPSSATAASASKPENKADHKQSAQH